VSIPQRLDTFSGGGQLVYLENIENWAPQKGFGGVILLLSLAGVNSICMGRSCLDVEPLRFGKAMVSRVGAEVGIRGKGLCVAAAWEWLERWGCPLEEARGGESMQLGLMDGCLHGLAQSVVTSGGPVGHWEKPWREAKALELISRTIGDRERFCDRHKRLTHDRIEKAKRILMADLGHPLGLAELARQVGCSAHYLSRQF